MGGTPGTHAKEDVGCHRTMCMHQFSPSTAWEGNIKLGLSGATGGAGPSWDPSGVIF